MWLDLNQIGKTLYLFGIRDGMVYSSLDMFNQEKSGIKDVPDEKINEIAMYL